MKRTLIISFLLISIASVCQTREEKVLGYYCGYSGSSTPVVRDATLLLVKKDYKSLRRLLYANSAAENFLGVVICKRLEYLKLIKLTQDEKNQIFELSKSDRKIPTCDGCTEHDDVALSKMLNSKSDVFFAIDYFFGENNWPLDAVYMQLIISWLYETPERRPGSYMEDDKDMK